MNLEKHRRWVWTDEETKFYNERLEGLSLHVCSGVSDVGDIRLDQRIYDDTPPGNFIIGDYRHLPIRGRSFDSVICDPEWGKRERLDKGIIGWLSELRRVAKRKVIIVLNTIFRIPGLELVECWAVRARGLLYKSLSIYTLVDHDGEWNRRKPE